VDKATASKCILSDLNRDDIDFLLCIGDGKNDEQLFGMFKDMDWAITATVGKKRTDAGWYMEGVGDVETLLVDIAHCEL
jgi:trehalose 6-phosphate synthase/phosphatase